MVSVIDLIVEAAGQFVGVCVLPACVFVLLAWCAACAVIERAYG